MLLEGIPGWTGFLTMTVLLEPPESGKGMELPEGFRVDEIGVLGLQYPGALTAGRAVVSEASDRSGSGAGDFLG